MLRYCFVLLCLPFAIRADDKPERVRHQITGLFQPDRVADLKAAFENLPDFKLVSVDYERAEATIEYIPAKAFPKAKPEQIVEQFDRKLGTVTNRTFGVKPLETLPKDKLQLIEIAVVGLDCKACGLAAYEAVYKLDGVERATASFKEGKVTAVIEPSKTDRSKLEAALVQKRVVLAPR